MKYHPVIFKSVLVVLSVFFFEAVYANLNSPILVLATDKKFGSYTTEILKTEGFNEFQKDSLTDAKVTLKYLKNFDIVILTETSLTQAHKELIKRFVSEGGCLIAFRPDKKLSEIFGIADANDTISEGYISINTDTAIGKGITKQTLQFHGTSDLYNLIGGKKIAALFTNAITPTEFPAVIMNDYGKGHAIAFVYNLPESIVYTRQGNYRYAGKEMDGIDGIRAMDLFTNGWVDTSKNTFNQADEQMRLLSHCIEKVSSFTKPLPRFWYFPDTLKCLVTLTNDGEDSKEAELEPQFADVDSKGAKMTLYIKETELVSKAWVDKWVNKGFEIAAHFDDTRQARNPTWKTMDSVIKDLKKKMNSKYGIANIQTVTNHWFVWCGKYSNGASDFTAQAKLEANNGLGLDNNYASYDNNSNQGYFLGSMGTGQGNYTGSGLSMKFANNVGQGINLYQHLCNVYDQQYMEHKDSTGFYDCFKGLMDRSLNNEVYSYISIKAHNNEYFFSKTPLLNMLDYANDNGIPVWTAAKLLEFLKAKDEAAFINIKWANNNLSYRIKSSLTHTNGITSMVPFKYNGRRISIIKINGMTTPYSVKTIKGYDYALVTIKPGSDYNMIVNYIY
ncbi:MAG: hypothetical protein ABI168_12305 [Ginsengibacter sp.]